MSNDHKCPQDTSARTAQLTGKSTYLLNTDKL